VNRPRFFLSLLLSSSLAFASAAKASSYIEAGTSLGSYKSAQQFSGQSAAGSGSGFLGSLSIYFPITSERQFFHFDLGLQNRFLSTSDSNGSPLALGSSEIGMRLQISRIYVGGGYAPLTYVSKAGSGLTSLHLNGGTSAYFFEGGAIWRVIPELQIAATYTMEFGLPSGGGTSPSPISEYGLRFRFPLNPTENSHGGGVDFDGFRYPFGFMK
jgi:hypothetical protein